MVEILKKGLLTVPVTSEYHKLGRLGVPGGGPMDICSCILANWLVGNADNAHVLEATMVLPDLRFQEGRAFAVVGGRCAPVLERAGSRLRIPMNQTIFAQAGDILTGGPLQAGLRVYISISGGFLRADRRPAPLSSGDVLPTGEPGIPKKQYIRRLPCRIPGEQAVLRVTEGVHAHQFHPDAHALFYHSLYTYLPQSDRMGIRFSGDIITFLEPYDGNILSEGVIPGDIQVTADGQPILMMVDCQTIGGYAKIGHVISADLPIAAQLRPGAQVRFRPVLLPEAQAAWRKMQYLMSSCLSPCQAPE